MASSPSKSPTLDIPRKSVELEDPGAHELESSTDDNDEFADATEGRDPAPLPPLSPVPITRVEKVDTLPSHGEVPGTPAYAQRTQDAVPDEIAVVPDGSAGGTPTHSRSPSRPAHSPTSPGGTPIPRTRVERVDTEPRHGEVPGTEAHQKRLADATPDAVVRADPMAAAPALVAVPKSKGSEQRAGGAVPDVVKKSPSESNRHLPRPCGARTTDMAERRRLAHKAPRETYRAASSPIAADGGFGPMPSDDEEADASDEDDSGPDDNQDDGQGGGADDFDDFEEGEEVDDFGDFDEGALPEAEPGEAPPAARQPVAPITPKFDVLDYSTLTSLDAILAATQPHLDALYPSPAPSATTTTADPATDSAADPSSPPPAAPAPPPATFLADRSASLWAQLVSPPPLQPPDWLRSRIRRLFLVSLGVPVDLDEVLPRAAPQKKLVLPYTAAGAGAQPDDDNDAPRTAAPEAPSGSSRGAAAGPVPPTPLTAGGSRSSRHARSAAAARRGPPPAPAFDAAAARALGATSDAALAGLGDAELRAHAAALDALLAQGQAALAYWVRRKEAAVGEKEAFDGVIENLVRHARRVRR